MCASQVFLGGGSQLLQLQQDLIPRSSHMLTSYHLLKHISQSLASSVPVDIMWVLCCRYIPSCRCYPSLNVILSYWAFYRSHVMWDNCGLSSHSDANLQHLSVLQLSDSPAPSTHRSGQWCLVHLNTSQLHLCWRRSRVFPLCSTEPPDGGGAVLSDGSQEDDHRSDLQSATESFSPPLESHDVHCGPPARSTTVSLSGFFCYLTLFPVLDTLGWIPS